MERCSEYGRLARCLGEKHLTLLPDLNAVGDLGTTFGPGSDRTRLEWGLDASWQVDLWGQIESRVEAERLRASATQEDYQAVALALSAEVARLWFSLIERHAQLALLEEQLESNRKGLKAQEAAFGLAGLSRSPDVLRQRQLVEATLEQQVVVKATIEVLEHQLALLQGRMPQTAHYDPGAVLPDLPPMPQTGLPSELLNRRPDVRRQYLEFMAADRDVAAAVTSQYPRINLTASLLNAAERPEDLFREWFLSIGSQLIGPLFDGGQRRAEIDRTTAEMYERFHAYGQTMLTAFRDVEDSLAREKYQLQRIERLSAQSELAANAAEQLFGQYILRDVDYLDWLSAIQSQQRLQRDTLSARLDLVQFRISLYLSLAGGFDVNSPAPVADVPPAVEPVESDAADSDADVEESDPPTEPASETVIDE